MERDPWEETGLSPKEQWSLSWPLSWAEGQGAQGGQRVRARSPGPSGARRLSRWRGLVGEGVTAEALQTHMVRGLGPSQRDHVRKWPVLCSAKAMRS